ncbi:MAG: DUF2809 domain-containing protein, partial [Desulfobulbaceae bacterium]|nr:DUF2809 domain-containing protein [Desulfobulbaceae bacterium]
FFRTYGGDTLWAVLVYLLAAIVLHDWKPWGVALSSLAFSYLIEVSQLYHAPWLDLVRATTLGGLVLGFGFLTSDLWCYTLGVSVAFVIDHLLCPAGHNR